MRQGMGVPFLGDAHWGVVSLLVVLAATLPYLNSLHGRYVYDDKVAVSGNPDVYRSDVTFETLLWHDYWGNDLFTKRGYGWTHHSWRPLVVLTFRWDWWMAGGDTFPFHVTNVLIHALACLSAYWAYVCVFGGRDAASQSRAAVAALLFALHPIHTECVANITSRADAAAAIFQLAALSVYALGVALPWRRDSSSAAAASQPLSCGAKALALLKAAAGFTLRCAAVVTLILLGLTCKETTLIMPALCVCVDIAAAMVRAALALRRQRRQLEGCSDSDDDDTACHHLQPLALGSAFDSVVAPVALAAPAAAGRGRSGSDDNGAAAGDDDAAEDAAAAAGSGNDVSGSSSGSASASKPKRVAFAPPTGRASGGSVASGGAAAAAAAAAESPVESEAAVARRIRAMMLGKHQPHKQQQQQRGGGNKPQQKPLPLHQLDTGAASSGQQAIAASEAVSPALPVVTSPVAAGAPGVVSPLPASGGSASAAASTGKAAGSAVRRSGSSSGCSVSLVGRYFWALAVELPWLRVAAYLAVGVAVYYVRIVIMAKGYTLHTWANPIHNTLYHMSTTTGNGDGAEDGGNGGHEGAIAAIAAFPWAAYARKVMAIAFVQAFALSKLVVPLFLSHEHNAMRHVTAASDPRNALTLAAWASLAALVTIALRRLARSAVRGGGSGGAAAAAGAAPSEALVAAGGVAGTPLSSSKVAVAPPTSASGGSGRRRRGSEDDDDAAAVAAAASVRGGDNVLQAEDDGASGVMEAARVSYRLLFGLAFVAVAYFPSSHLVQYVAFILAERTLFLPSFGAAIVLAEVLALAAEWAQRRLCGGSGDAAASAAEATKASPTPRRWWSVGGSALYRLLLGALAAYYVGRTVTRNAEWANEEVLMASNLALYPDNNTMTVYGLGAVALYKGELDDAERYLKQAITESSMVEPRILLSQLYWKHKPYDIVEGNKTGHDVALEQLDYVSRTSSPRKEVLTNLGMLQYRRAKQIDTEALKTAEYHILAAHVAHGYPEGHHAIALLASNAGCIRLLSAPDRFGNPRESEVLFNEALKIAREGGTPAAFRNAATFYAVQGYDEHAFSILDEGIKQVETALNKVLEGTDPSWPGSKQQMVHYFSDVLYALQRMKLSIGIHAGRLMEWAAVPPVAGPVIEERMGVLGFECYLELLWW